MAEMVFISFNTDWPEINQFCDLLSFTGFEPLILEKLPNLGMNPDEKAKHYMKESNKIIFIITKDAVDSNGNFHPKSNVALEIGLSDQFFEEEDKIYVIVDDAKQPSMLNKTYISYSKKNYLKAVKDILENLGFSRDKTTQKTDYAKLTELEIYCLLVMADTPYGSVARPELISQANERYKTTFFEFNIAINKLIQYGLIGKGIIASGHDHSGDYHYKISDKGWRYLSTANSESGDQNRDKGVSKH